MNRPALHQSRPQPNSAAGGDAYGSAMGKTLKIVQWTTGNVARQTVRAVLAHPDQELVGVYAHSPDKVGRDVGELVGLDSIGVAATDDVDALLALEPDCVVYTPLHPDLDDLTRLLGAGVNVVTSSEFLTGNSLGDDFRDGVEAAARAGGASIFGSGMNPGFAQLLAGVCAGVCVRLHHVRVTEAVDTSLFAGDSNMDALGWGRPAGDPGHADDVAEATVVFADGLDVLAELLGLDLDDRRCTVEFALATRDLDLPGRPIAAGTVGGLEVRWEGVVDDRPVIEIRQIWVMANDLDPAWAVEHAYLVEIDGEPKIRARFEIWPHQEDLSSLTTTDIHSLGMVITGLPVVNAIPAVCAAEPGIRTYADLPVITSARRLGTGPS
jgi:2,4-diaminopentanoate dehydrogenase